MPRLTFSFNEGEIDSIGADHWEVAGDPSEYWTAIDAWLSETYPDVHAGFGPRVEGEEALPSAEDLAIALEYVDEFLASSEVYPLDGTGG